MKRCLLVLALVLVLVGLAWGALASRATTPADRPDCRLIFIEVEVGDPDLDQFTIYAPLYVCRKVEA